MKNAVKIAQLIIAATLVGTTAQANTVSLGAINLTGTFTLNHNFDFNNPIAPFGTFGTMTVQTTTGLFSPYVSPGDVLAMNTPSMFLASGTTPILIPGLGTFFGSLPQPMQWSIGGFTLDTLWTNITGADFVGQNVLGLGTLSGNGFDPSAYGFGAFASWDFTAPPYNIANFPEDITGPIELSIGVAYDNGHVSDSGPTLTLVAISIFGLFIIHRKVGFSTGLCDTKPRRAG